MAPQQAHATDKRTPRRAAVQHTPRCTTAHTTDTVEREGTRRQNFRSCNTAPTDTQTAPPHPRTSGDCLHSGTCKHPPHRARDAGEGTNTASHPTAPESERWREGIRTKHSHMCTTAYLHSRVAGVLSRNLRSFVERVHQSLVCLLLLCQATPRQRGDIGCEHLFPDQSNRRKDQSRESFPCRLTWRCHNQRASSSSNGWV